MIMYDTTECFMALCVSIFKAVPPERAFDLLSLSPDIKRTDLSDDDTKDMIKFKNECQTYQEIADIYGVDKASIYRRIKVFNAKEARNKQ